MASPKSYSQYNHYHISFPVEHVVHVEINRPSKLNSFIEPMWLQLIPLFHQISSDSDVRAVILSGAGDRAFTSGLDVQAASSNSPLSPTWKPSSPSAPPDTARIADHTRKHVLEFQAGLTAVADCQKPVIAALHGFCFGLGIDLSLCADVRVCAANTQFSVKEVDIGIAADIGTLSRLPKAVGSASWAKDICLSGRIFGCIEALDQGYVSWAGKRKDSADGAKQEVMEQALAWARLVAGKSPVAVQGTKEILNWSWDRSVADGLRYTAVWNSAMLQTRDVTESMQAGMMKRKPTFEKL